MLSRLSRASHAKTAKPVELSGVLWIRKAKNKKGKCCVVLLRDYFFLSISNPMMTTTIIIAIPTPTMVHVGSIGCGYSGGGVGVGGASVMPIAVSAYDGP
jgi:hypothetical protein